MIILKAGKIFLFLLSVVAGINAKPHTVQSMIVKFPVSGRIIVEAREELGKFPQMLFISQKSGRVLLRSSIKDDEKNLIPVEGDKIRTRPDLRFRTIYSKGFQSPLMMSVATYHGGSDSQFFLTVFGEVNGKIRRFNDRPLFTNIQGGFYLGYLNKKLGYGLAAWRFIWGNAINESHYGSHHYQMEIYRLQGRKLKKIIDRVSRKMYESDNGAASLRELGIKAADQRTGIPGMILD